MDADMKDYDNVQWDRDDEIYEKAILTLRRFSICERLETLTSQECGQKAVMKGAVRFGGYNAIYTMKFPEGTLRIVITRVHIHGSVKFPEEKTLSEVATMKFLAEKTKIPVPTVLHYGIAHQNPATGPYIIMSYISNSGSLSAALNDPLIKEGDPHILNQFIDLEKLSNLYTQMARQLLEISQHHFPHIGSLLVDPETNSYTVATRPLSVNMNQGMRLARIPPQLICQHNDLVENEDDCRNKYMSCLLFFKLAKAGKLSIFGFEEDDWSEQSKSRSKRHLLPAPSNTGDFSLWCDDLRAGNVLLDHEEKIASLIDFEFTYSAPRQFALDPPWWLLLEQSERWDDGLLSWSKIYDERVQVWFDSMEKAEEESGSKDNLARYMRESWTTGRFWMNYAARKSWAFDGIYWKILDEKFFGAREVIEEFGSRERWRSRVGMINLEEREAMDKFVEGKMEERNERKIFDWEPEEARERLADELQGCQEVGGMMDALNLI